ncbi:MAG: hypothetical protein U0232_02575 [Thermomicrobiales bacterium]
MSPEPVATLLRVAAALDRLGLAYCVGGSFASSFYSLPRSTNDIDLVVALRPEHVTLLVAALEHDYMIDPQAVSMAIAQERSFNIIDLTTFDKIDIFVMKREPWSQQQIRRRRPETLSGEPDAPILFFASPEDVILSKLVWYRNGGEVSDRQWLDILNVLALQADNLDWAYLHHWASELSVSDLLRRASTLTEPGGPIA